MDLPEILEARVFLDMHREAHPLDFPGEAACDLIERMALLLEAAVEDEAPGPVNRLRPRKMDA